jgi:hypothetical protein
MRYLLFIFLLIFNTGNAQNAEENKLKHHEIQVGFGIWLANSHTNINLKKSGAGGGVSSLEYRYYTKNKFAVGISFERCKTANENNPDDTTLKTAGAEFSKAGINFRYLLISKPKFNYFIGTNHLFNSFTLFAENNNGVAANLVARGFSHSLSTGFNWYFSKYIGMFGDYNLQLQGVKGKRFTFKGVDQEFYDYIPLNKVFFSFRGTALKIGLTIRF